jgi:polysaccharide biosynthesis protein PelF
MKRALLINWDSYPHYTSGGVYTWAKGLIENIQDWEFVVLNQLSNPNANAKFSVPSNVKKVIGLPVFGAYRVEEYLGDTGPLLPKIMRTTDSVVDRQFLPLYNEFLREILADNCDPERLSELISKLHNFLTLYDSRKCFESPQVWEAFLEQVSSDPLYKQMKLREALLNFQVLQHSLQLLSLRMPKVNLVHSSLAWLPALAGIAAKQENDCPMIVTEHGVAFRELVLYYSMFLYNEPSKIFWTKFSRNIVRTVYRKADLIVPVCHANEIWEVSLGANPSKIKVIYNGVDVGKFRPMNVKTTGRPTVVSVARISVFKDIAALIHATNYVRQQIADIQCLVFGESTEPEYSGMCVELVDKLKLKENFKFMGGTKEPEKAYALGDVVAFSSITEGFPFAVIEAMACGKAVVATDVGGVSEALEGCGLIVKSRSPRELANAMLKLLGDRELRRKFGDAALTRARQNFDLKVSIAHYREVYESLTGPVMAQKSPQKTEAPQRTEVLVR